MSTTRARTTDALPSLDGPIPALFCAAGLALAVVGAVPWIAALAASGSTVGWPIRILGVAAILVGVFVMLVGVGLFRARNALRAAADEAELDASLMAAAAEATRSTEVNESDRASAHDACAAPTACASCDATCALSALR